MSSLLIIGCGSIGERHLRCFAATGRAQLSACDANPALLEKICTQYAVPGFSSLDEALASGGFDGAVICTPAHLHLPMARQLLEAGLHLLIEKPLATDQTLVPEVREAIARSGRVVAVAYVYHFMAAVAAARSAILRGELGRLLEASVVSGQHFPTFRPAYREIYYRDRRTGGGAIQDALTHLVNAMEWMLGPVSRVFCDASHRALEGVEVEDFAHVAARHGEIPVSYAMTQFQAPNEHVFLIHGELASLRIEIHQQRWGLMQRGETQWQWRQCPPVERDTLFMAQAAAFLDALEGKTTDLCSFEEAVQTLRFNEAALQSANRGEVIHLSPLP
jgi:predicted dehydrogenase